MPPLDALGGLVSDPVEQLGNVALGTLAFGSGALVALVFSLVMWIGARVDLVIFTSARLRYDPLDYPYRLRQLQADVRNAGGAVELQLAFLSIAALVAIAQHNSTAIVPAAHPSAFAAWAPLVFIGAEWRQVWGSIRNVRDRQLDERAHRSTREM